MKPEPKFKVGDLVRISYGYIESRVAGKFAKIEMPDVMTFDGEFRLKVEGIQDNHWYAKADDLKLVEPAPECSGYQEYASGGLSARGMSSREAHIRQIEDLQRVIRSRNEQIHADRAEITELRKMLDESKSDNTLNNLADHLGLTAAQASEALELGARQQALGVKAGDIDDIVKIKARGLR